MGINPHLSRAVLLVSAAVSLVAAYGASAYAVGERSEIGAAPHYLFICSGDQARQAPDFLAVVNFNERSAEYGKIIATAPFPPTDATGNEPHHIGLSDDGKVIACGGLLSVLKGQKEIFFFDVANPRSPRFISAGDPPLSSITDDFQALPGGGFLVTMMGGPAGHAPGRVAEFDHNLHLVHEYPDEPPTDGFNPHGISLRPEINLMVTSDFLDDHLYLLDTQRGTAVRLRDRITSR
jgi:56kDa selenium binding protein (SBP56)